MGGSNRQADRSRTGQRKKARKSAAKTVKKAVYKKTYTKQQLIDAKALLAKKMDAQSSSKQLRSDQSSGKSTQYLKKLAKAVIAELGSKIPVTTLTSSFTKNTNIEKKRYFCPNRNVLVPGVEENFLKEWIDASRAQGAPPSLFEIRTKAWDLVKLRGGDLYQEFPSESWASRFCSKEQDLGLVKARTRDRNRAEVPVEDLYEYYYQLEKLIEAENPRLVLVFDETGFEGYNARLSKMKVVVRKGFARLAYRVTPNLREHITLLTPFILDRDTKKVHLIPPLFIFAREFLSSNMAEPVWSELYKLKKGGDNVSNSNYLRSKLLRMILPADLQARYSKHTHTHTHTHSLEQFQKFQYMTAASASGSINSTIFFNYMKGVCVLCVYVCCCCCCCYYCCYCVLFMQYHVFQDLCSQTSENWRKHLG
jgi:hypothetical protein